METRRDSSRVLYVEDDEEVYASTLFVLELFFASVDPARAVGEARERIRRERYDIALLDIYLPDGNGFSLVQALRERNPEVQIIILSSYPEFENMRLSIRLHVDDFLPKPYTFDALREVLARCREEKGKSPDSPASLPVPLAEGFRFHPADCTVETPAGKVELTRGEGKLVELLCASAGAVVRFSTLNSEIFQRTCDDDSSSVKNLVYRLRKKLGLNLFDNVHGVGYRFVPPEPRR